MTKEEIAQAALGLTWWDVESQARRVCEYTEALIDSIREQFDDASTTVLTDEKITALASQFIIDSGQDFDMVGFARRLLAVSMGGDRT